MSVRTKNIAIFASGTGTNAENIIRHFNSTSDSGARVALVASNNPDAPVLEKASALGVATVAIGKGMLRDETSMTRLMSSYKIDMIVLAGFLLMVPAYLIALYDGRIVNIHPSLLPRHGGKGMYGIHVHEAVVAARDKATGITIHIVSEAYDEGRILFQASTPVDSADTPADVARKVQQLEQKHYPEVIARLLRQM